MHCRFLLVSLLLLSCGEAGRSGAPVEGSGAANHAHAADAGTHRQHDLDAGTHETHAADAADHPQHDLDGGSHEQHAADAGDHPQHDLDGGSHEQHAADAGSHEEHGADAGSHGEPRADAGAPADAGTPRGCSPSCAVPTPHCIAGVCEGCLTLGCAGGESCNGATGLCDEAPTAKAVGDGCASAVECPAGGSGTPECLTAGYPGGYCSVLGCAGHGHDCPDDAGLDGAAGAKCVSFGGLRCMKLCGSNADCRSGYTCRLAPDGAGHGSAKVCLP